MSRFFGEDRYRAELFEARFGLDADTAAYHVAKAVTARCRRYNLSPQDAEEITNDILMYALVIPFCESPIPPNQPPNPEAWLHVVSRYKVHDFHKKVAQRTRSEAPLDERTEFEISTHDEISVAEAIRREEQAVTLVESVISTLSPEYQEVIRPFWDPIELTFRVKPDGWLSADSKSPTYPERPRYTYREMVEILWGPSTPSEQNNQLQVVGRACRKFKAALIAAHASGGDRQT